MDISEITSDFFWPQAYPGIFVPDPYDFSDSLSAPEAASLFIAFDKACLDSDAYIGDYSTLNASMVKSCELYNVVPIALLDIKYHDFIENALTDSLVYFVDGKYYDNPFRTTSPYVENDALCENLCLKICANPC